MRFISFAFCLLLIVVSSNAFACTSSNTDSASVDGLSVSTVSMSFSEDEEGILTTLGTIKNPTGGGFDAIVVEVRYCDQKSRLIDTFSQKISGLVVPPGREVAFRVRGVAAQPKHAYASQSARVIAADARNAKSLPKTLWQDIVSGFGPMLLLLGVWLWTIRKGSLKQNAIFQTQNAMLERIAQAIERRGEAPPGA